MCVRFKRHNGTCFKSVPESFNIKVSAGITASKFTWDMGRRGEWNLLNL